MFVASVACRHRPKEKCPTPPPGNITSPWCYTSVLGHGSSATPRVSPNLILVAETSRSRVYITEGPITQTYPNYADSIEVVFETGVILWDKSKLTTYPDTAGPNLTVSTISSSIITAVITSNDFPFIFRYAEYAENTGRTVHFHKDWLFDARQYLPDTRTSEGEPVVNITNLGNSTFENFGRTVLLIPEDEWVFNGIWDLGRNANDPEYQELIVAGAFASLMSAMHPSDTQYTNWSFEDLPADSRPETPRWYSQPPTRVISVFNLGYRFQLSARTSILGITVRSHCDVGFAMAIVLGAEDHFRLGYHS